MPQHSCCGTAGPRRHPEPAARFVIPPKIPEPSWQGFPLVLRLSKDERIDDLPLMLRQAQHERVGRLRDGANFLRAMHFHPSWRRWKPAWRVPRSEATRDLEWGVGRRPAGFPSAALRAGLAALGMTVWGVDGKSTWTIHNNQKGDCTTEREVSNVR
jgi:hypothetical protein